MSLLTAAQRKEIPYLDSQPAKRCQPWSKKALLAPDFVYPAAVSVYLGGAKLLDNFYDEKSLSSKALFALQKKTIRKAEETLRGFGLTLPPVEDLISEQLRREAVDGRELSHYSEVTEEVTSRVFAHTATLAEMAGNYDHLAQVGRHAARIAYLVDSYADLQSDNARGLFNPLNHAIQPPKSIATKKAPDSMLVDHLNQSFSTIRDQVRRVKLNRFEDAIRHTVTDELQARVEHLLATPRTVALRSTVFLIPMAVSILLSFLVNGPIHAAASNSFALAKPQLVLYTTTTVPPETITHIGYRTTISGTSTYIWDNNTYTETQSGYIATNCAVCDQGCNSCLGQEVC